jgi:hypothetical protein
MTSTWLHKKRKGELLDLAREANLSDIDGLLKEDLVHALQQHLEANEFTYGKLSSFSDFYKRTGSPIKRERVSPPDGSNAISVNKTRRRQTTTKLLENHDSEEQTPVKALVARAPRTVSRAVTRVTSQVDIPASPAQLANVADQSFQVARTKAEELWKKTYIEEAVEYVREHASSVTAVDIFVLIIEAIGLQWNTLKVEPAFNTPSIKTVGLDSYQVRLPDYTKLLTSDFWAPATLWSLTSIFVPLIVSYFFNLTLRSNTRHKSSRTTYTSDPLTYSIVKALMQYIVYNPIANPSPVPADSTLADIVYPSWGPFAGSTRVTVAQSVIGGYNGLQIGAAIGVLASLYDAALKK